MPSVPYKIRYANEAVDDVRGMRKFDQRKLVSKSRIKAMAQPFWSQYRLRVDEFHVYYDVDDDHRIVNVLRVLIKTSDQTPGKTP